MEAVDAATMYVPPVLVARAVDLVEIPQGQPHMASRWFLGEELRKEIIFSGVRGRPIDRSYLEAGVGV